MTQDLKKLRELTSACIAKCSSCGHSCADGSANECADCNQRYDAWLAPIEPRLISALLDEIDSLHERLRDEFVVGAEYQRQSAIAQSQLARITPVYEAAVAWRDCDDDDDIPMLNKLSDAIDAAAKEGGK